MPSTNADLFVIEGAILGNLHPNSVADDSKDIPLDYVNSWATTVSEDSLSARADGKNKITIKANKALQFTVECEVLNRAAMLFLLGAEEDDAGKITVSDTPSETYTYTGVARMKFADGTKKLMDITIPNCTPQIGDLGTSSLDLQTYSIVFDCGTDADGNFLTMEEHV